MAESFKEGGDMRKVLGWAAAAAGSLVAILLLMHVFISPVNPKQEVPDVHVATACWACHTVSDSVEIREP